MKLIELINFLEGQPQELVVKQGLTNPHSFRGVYSELAFEIGEEMTVGDILKMAKSCLNETFEGYKGGDFTMDEYTTIHIANYGSSETFEWLWAMQWMVHNKA